MRETGLTWI